MRESSRRPRRLKARRPLLEPRDRSLDAEPLPTGGPRMLRPLRVIRRGGGVLLWTLPCMAIQAICLMLPGRAKIVYARFYWSVVCRLLGVHVRTIGSPTSRTSRSVVFVANHSSWLDVPVLGGRIEACFVSKDEVGRW